MTQRRDLERQHVAFGEILNIMNAMKNLALFETRKLARFLATQRRVVESLKATAADFRFFHSGLFKPPAYRGTAYVLIGSERGFCGDYNDALLRALGGRLAHENGGEVVLLPVGYRLTARMADDPRVAERLDGPGVVEEIEAVLIRLVETLNVLQHERGPLRTVVLHHRAEDEEVTATALDPFELTIPNAPRFAVPPRLYLAPQAFLAGLLEQYLFAGLYELFYNALMAENERRIRHMDGAIRRLEDESARLKLRYNMLRQEEITEEIEIIMLSAESMARAGPGQM
jgi:F-type H+-transporting ATPase subunit gamma